MGLIWVDGFMAGTLFRLVLNIVLEQVNLQAFRYTILSGAQLASCGTFAGPVMLRYALSRNWCNGRPN